MRGEGLEERAAAVKRNKKKEEEGRKKTKNKKKKKKKTEEVKGKNKRNYMQGLIMIVIFARMVGAGPGL